MSFPSEKTELRKNRSPFCLEPTHTSADSRETFLGKTDKEDENKITGRNKTVETGWVRSVAIRRSRLGMGIFSSVNISARI